MYSLLKETPPLIHVLVNVMFAWEINHFYFIYDYDHNRNLFITKVNAKKNFKNF